MILRAATVAVEIAHLGTDGRLHGHSLTIEAWTDKPVCLDAWRGALGVVAEAIGGQIEATIGGRTFEDVGQAVLEGLPDCIRVVVRLPTRGHVIEIARS